MEEQRECGVSGIWDWISPERMKVGPTAGEELPSYVNDLARVFMVKPRVPADLTYAVDRWVWDRPQVTNRYR